MIINQQLEKNLYQKHDLMQNTKEVLIQHHLMIQMYYYFNLRNSFYIVFCKSINLLYKIIIKNN